MHLLCTFYEAKHQETGLWLVSRDYEQAFKDCALDGFFSSAWTMQAAATVLKRDIVSIYPTLNGVLDRCVPILNTTFQPRTKSTGHPVYIMWSSTYYPKPKKPGLQIILFHSLLIQIRFVYIFIDIYNTNIILM